MTRPSLVVTLNRFTGLFGGDVARAVDAARRADDAGVDGIVVTDHVLIGPRTDRYPFGTFSFPPDESWPEPLTVLTAVAARTSRIRLATGVLIAPARPAPLLAKTVATLDALSGGRVQLGLGTGWQREEIEACGAPMRGRTARLEDTIAACRALWAGGPATFHSPTVSFTDMWCVPAPAQGASLPIWLAGPPTAAVADRIARLGDGWLPIVSDAEHIAEGARLVREAAAAAGREPASVGVRASLARVGDADGRPDLVRTLEAGVPALLDAGCTEVGIGLGAFVRSEDDIDGFLTELMKRWRALTEE